MRLPEIDFQISPELLKFGSWLFDMTGNIYQPDELLTMNKEYVFELFTWRRGRQFFIDYSKRDSHFK